MISCNGRESLYNEHEALTAEGVELSDQVTRAMKSIFEVWRARGHSLREIGHIMSQSVGCLESELVLRAAMEHRKSL